MSGLPLATQDGDREALIRDAVSFLRDPKVTSSPLTQRAQFLESKGLTSSEIELALQRAASSHADPSSSSTKRQPSTDWDGFPEGNHTSSRLGNFEEGREAQGYGLRQGLMRAPELPRRDWRDLFIMAVVSGGVMYGVASLARKYLLPHLQPPSSTAFQTTSEELAAQFDEATNLLKSLQDQTTSLQTTIDQDRLKVDAVVIEVEEGIKRVSDGEDRWREELRELRDEVAEMRELVPKMIEKHSQSQQTAFQDLQTELRSLKTLLVARRPLPATNSSNPPPLAQASSSQAPENHQSPAQSTPAPPSEITNAANALLQPRSSSAASGSYGGMFGSNGKPSIPAWQLEAAKSYKEAEAGRAGEGSATGGTGKESGRSTPAENEGSRGNGSGSDRA